MKHEIYIWNTNKLYEKLKVKYVTLDINITIVRYEALNDKHVTISITYKMWIKKNISEMNKSEIEDYEECE